MQVSPTCEVKEVPGQDRWKFLHIFQLIRVRTKFPCNGTFDCNLHCPCSREDERESRLLVLLPLTQT